MCCYLIFLGQSYPLKPHLDLELYFSMGKVLFLLFLKNRGIYLWICVVVQPLQKSRWATIFRLIIDN